MTGPLDASFRAGPGAGSALIVLAHEGFGLTPFVSSACTAFCAEGFDVIAPALYWREDPICYRYDDPAAAARAIEQDTSALVADLVLTAERDGNRRPVGLVGWCLGAMAAAVAAASSGPFSAVSAYYPVRLSQQRILPPARVPTLVHLGLQDEFATPDDWTMARELTATDASDLRVYPRARHGFANSDRPERYDPRAAQVAHAATVSWLRRSLLPGRSRAEDKARTPPPLRRGGM